MNPTVQNGIYRTPEPYNVRFDDAVSEPDVQTLNVVPHVENFNIQVIDDSNHTLDTYQVVDVSAKKAAANTAPNIVATNKPVSNSHIANASGSNVNATPTRNNVQVAGSSDDVSQPKIRLPMYNIPEYQQIENILEDEDIDSKPGMTMLFKQTVVRHCAVSCDQERIGPCYVISFYHNFLTFRKATPLKSHYLIRHCTRYFSSLIVQGISLL